MKRSMSERSPSGSSGASSRTSPVFSAASDCTTSSELRRVGDLFRRRLATQRLPEILGSAHDAGQIGGPVQRHAHCPALPGERREDRLADPPHGVRDELDALVGIELARRGEQTDVALADEIGEWQPAVLILLGDRNHEAQVALDELLHRLLITRADLPGERDLLLLRQQRSLRDLVQVLIEDVALVLVMAQPREQAAAPATTLDDPSLSRRDGRLRLGLRSRRSCLCLFTSARHWVALFGCSLLRSRDKNVHGTCVKSLDTA